MALGHKKNKIDPSSMKAQTFVEYTLLIGIAASILITMTPMIRRGVQGMVKGVADQVGNQVDSEQDGGEDGYLVYSYQTLRTGSTKNTSERPNVIQYNFVSEWTDTTTATMTNLGRGDG